MKPYWHILWGVVVLNLQALTSSRMLLWGGTPNFLVPYTIVLALTLEAGWYIPIVFVLGLGYDLLYPQLLGLNTFALLLVALSVGRWHAGLNKERFASVILAVFIVNVGYFGLYQVYQMFIEAIVLPGLGTALWQLGYNTIVSLVWIYSWAVFRHIKVGLDV